MGRFHLPGGDTQKNCPSGLQKRWRFQTAASPRHRNLHNPTWTPKACPNRRNSPWDKSAWQCTRHMMIRGRGAWPGKQIFCRISLHTLPFRVRDAPFLDEAEGRVWSVHVSWLEPDDYKLDPGAHFHCNPTAASRNKWESVWCAVPLVLSS